MSDWNGWEATAMSVVSKYTAVYNKSQITRETIQLPKEIYSVLENLALTWYVFLVTKSNYKFHCLRTNIAVDNHERTLVQRVNIFLDLSDTEWCRYNTDDEIREIIIIIIIIIIQFISIKTYYSKNNNLWNRY